MKIIQDSPTIRSLYKELAKTQKRYDISKRYKMQGKEWTDIRPHSYFPPNDLEKMETTFRGKISDKTYIIKDDYVGVGFVTTEIDEV